MDPTIGSIFASITSEVPRFINNDNKNGLFLVGPKQENEHGGKAQTTRQALATQT